MNAPQIIKTPNGEEMVILSKADYEALVQAADDALEDATDIAIYDARKAEAEKTEPFPAELSMAMLRGEGRLKALRKWRRLTQSGLAERAGLTQGFLSDLESHRRTASAEATSRLAEILDVPVAWIES